VDDRRGDVDAADPHAIFAEDIEMRTWQTVFWGIAILVAVMLGFGSWYKIHYSMGTAREFEVNSRSIKPKVLLATQGSDFKDSIVRGIVEHLKSRSLPLVTIRKTSRDSRNASRISLMRPVGRPRVFSMSQAPSATPHTIS
jgi:hypothetical protein